MTNSNPHQGVICPDCLQRMFSYWGHDFKRCGCKNETMVDGGKGYLRYGGHKLPKIITYDEELDGLKVQVRPTNKDSNDLRKRRLRRRTT